MTAEEMEIVRAHCLAEREARRRWAETVTEEWTTKASAMSLEMVEEALNMPIDEQAEALFQYWKMRAEGVQEGRPIDRDARRQWDALLAGEVFEGDFNFWQRSVPATAEVSVLPR